LLAKLGDAHTHLDAARNHIASGEREIAVLCLELSCGAVIEAREISRGLGGPGEDLQLLSILLGQLTGQVTKMQDPLSDDRDFIQLRLRLRDASERLQRNMAQSRYTYEFLRYDMAIPAELIGTILERTRERKLSWSELSSTGFTAPIMPNSLIIDQTTDRRGNFEYVLRIANEQGTVLDTTSEDLGWDGPLQQIYELARRQALRVDETLVNIKDALEKL
jgi:hypothetical protein